jgi:23S rRNA (guanine745-N1)-methyltransferase
MLADVIDLLRCPHCQGELRLARRTAGCASGHRFDLARHGQLNLLRRAAGATADTAAMVAARAEFLAAGHYAPIADLLAGAAVGSVAVEAGAGTGYYLQTVVAGLGPGARGVAADLSAYACRRSAKLPRIGAVVADTWAGLPVRDAVADSVLAVFAPRNFADFARICAPAGRVLVVTPLPHHLAEVRRVRGLLEIEEGKQDRLLAGAEPWLEHEGFQHLTYPVTLPAADVDRLVGMGPTAFHVDRVALPRECDDTTPVTTTVAVRVDSFRPQSAAVQREV